MRVLMVAIGLMLGGLAFGQDDPSFYATVDRNEIGPDDPLRVSFVLENARGTRFKRPTFSDFVVISQGHSSSGGMTVIINGQRVEQGGGKETWTFLVKPRSTGTLNIGPASVYVDGKQYTTETLTIKVDRKAGQNNNNQNQNLPRKDIFLRITADKSEAYVGEQILLSYKIYTRYGIDSYSQPNMTLSGFWKEDIPIKRPQQRTEVINGLTYRTAIIQQTIIFPQRSGTIDIPPAEMDVNISVSFFRSRKERLTSNTLTLKVKDLPAGAPAAFTGAVGDLSLESNINTTETTTDEPITLTLTLEGSGNLKLVDLPTLELPNDFEVYDPKVSDNISSSGGRMRGTKEYEYLIIPRQPGTYKLEPVEYAYFKPSTGRYEKLVTEPYELKVTKGAGYTGSNTVTNISKEDIELLGKDIRYIQTNYPSSGLLTGNIYGTPLFFTLLGSPFLLLLLLFAWRKRQIEQRADVASWKQRKAYSKAKKSLQQAQKQTDDRKAFYQAAGQALWMYLSERLGIPQAELSKEMAIEALTKAEVDMATNQRLLEYFDTCEMAAYAPMGASSEPDQLASEGQALLQQLEKQIKA